MNFSVIIPSRNAANLVPCVEAIFRAEPNLPRAKVIVVDDGAWVGAQGALPGVWPVKGKEPFVFARNVNLGIRAAGADDVILLNDDALLDTAGGFSALARVASEHPEFGVISAACNLAAAEQHPRGVGLREVSRVVAYVCAYISRRTIEVVGLLDERFGGVDEFGRRIYGWEDNDHCRRIRNAGLKLGVYDGCYVDHGSLHSTFRGDARAAADIEPGRRVYMAKWGDCN